MTNAETILHLIEARKRLAQGWCQGVLRRFGSAGDERCLVGALMESGDMGSSFLETVNVLKGALSIPGDATWWPPHDLIGWNDEPGRTQQEVLDVVDHAIASLMKVEAAEVVSKELVDA